MKTALLSGYTGQDGSYLAEFLLEKGYEVHAFVRRSANPNQFYHNQGTVDDVEVHWGDLTDATSVFDAVRKVQPDELYNLGAQADVGESFWMQDYSIEVNYKGPLYCLQAIKRFSPDTKFYQASTSELFGNAEETPQNEETKMNPQSPYAWGKYAGYQATKIYRESEGLFACNGILFNHESERRGVDYLTRKVTRAVARIKAGLQDELRLGNLDSKRDWGYSPEYVEAAWLMLQQDRPDDYVIGTGETHTVKEWVAAAFAHAGLDWEDYVVQDERFMRPAEVHVLLADASKAKRVLGWEPEITFSELVKIMVNNDIGQTTKS